MNDPAMILMPVVLTEAMKAGDWKGPDEIDHQARERAKALATAYADEFFPLPAEPTE